ncbi:McrB family protein [Thermodesulfobacteriota bacterium]
MKNPFCLSDEDLRTLLKEYTTWYQGAEKEKKYAVEQEKNAEDIRSKLLNKSYLEEQPKDKLIQDILAYSKTLEGPAHIRIGEPRVTGQAENIKRNLLYLIDSPDSPIKKAARILDGDYKIPIFAKAFWTPIFQAQHPEILPNWNNKSERFLKKVGINLQTSKLSTLEKYSFLSDAFIYLHKLDPKQNFYNINHLMHYGTEIEEGSKLIEKLLTDKPGDDLALQIAKWQKEHVSDERIKTRQDSESEARNLLSTKAGKFQEDELREFLRLINQDYWRGKVYQTRFGMAYSGNNTKRLVEQLELVNDWMYQIWNVSEAEIRNLLDKFYTEKPIKNAGTAFPSVILYLRDSSKFNLCFKKMEQGLIRLTGFKERGYSGSFYLKYNSTVNELKEKYKLSPQELDILLCIDEKDPPIDKTKLPTDETNPDCPFNPKTFELLSGLYSTPQKDFYHANKDDFKNYLETPFQDLFHKIAKELPMEVKNYLELEKQLFSRILKNDWGKGGAWDFYWGAFYPKGGKRIEDAQLFLWINREILEFGFFIGVYGSEQNKRFLNQCKYYKESHLHILRDSLSNENFFFGRWDRKLDNGNVPSNLKETTWQEWLEDPEANGINVSVILTKDEILSLSEKQLVDKISRAFSELFPLFILTVSNDPIADINAYIGEIELPETQPIHPLNQIAEETGFPIKELERWVAAVERKGQAIFYGPPGTGKTFAAEHLARHLIGGGDGFYDIVQFHPAYAYEDFVQGIRPKAREDGQLDYPIVPGRFIEVCKRARRCKDRCVLIIDEINRANLARVFGELMYLLEYRDRNAPLASGGILQIPENVRIIGTMNTADRSIALVDHALRRRFAFFSLYPNYSILRNYHKLTKFNAEPLIHTLEKLNRQIGDRHYEIGISFFLRKELSKDIEDIWRMEIEPYLEEYFFDQPDKVDEFRWKKVGKEILP